MVKRKGLDLNVPVIRGTVLGVDVVRGYARLCDLAKVSQADVYDQLENPTGTQRDLNFKHAVEAYEYVSNQDLAFWPEVFLCVRDHGIVTYAANSRTPSLGVLTVDLSQRKDDSIAISRVDGNHRLHLADGSNPEYPPIKKEVSFCLAMDLSLEQEIILFRDINDNQRRMNTSHLDNIEARLTPEDILKREEPDLFIARRLGQDADSPLYQRIYEGGKKRAGQDIPLRTLTLGIRYMLSRPTKLRALRDADAQYKVVRNYFSAVAGWQPQGWNEPKKYLVLRGAGLWAICYIGAEVADRALSKGTFDAENMLAILNSGRTWDWSNKGDFEGFSGAGGALKIADSVTSEFQDESGLSVRQLFKQIMND